MKILQKIDWLYGGEDGIPMEKCMLSKNGGEEWKIWCIQHINGAMKQ